MEKKKRRFNVIDALIIILVLAAAAVAGYVLLSERGDVGSGDEKVSINYVLMADEMRSVFADNIKVGDPVYDQDSKKPIGKVVQVSSAVSRRTGTNRQTGEQVFTDLQNRRDLYVTVEAEAEHSDNMYLVSGINIVVGGVINFMTPNLMLPSNIISVEKVEG